MTRKHFNAIAGLIKVQVDCINGMDNKQTNAIDHVENIARDLALYFKTINPAFDYDRFMKACGF